MSRTFVSVSRRIPADAQTLFDIVADPARHTEFDGSGSVRAGDAGNPARLELGARFGMSMKILAEYHMDNTVTEFEEGRLIGWRPATGHTWRYLFEPVDGGTLVTEQWDARGTRRSWLPALLGFPRRNRKNITRTLARLEQVALGA